MINIHDFYFVFQLFVDPNKLLPLARFLPRPAGSKPTGGGGGGRGGRGGGRGRILLFAAVKVKNDKIGFFLHFKTMM
jgi:hypothetical protein